MAPVVKDGLSIERIYQELVKMHEKNALASGLKWLLSLNLLVPLFPALSQQTPSLLFLKISKLEKIKSPSPLIFFLAYLFDLKTKEDLETFIKALKAPNSELNLGMHFLSFMNEKHLSSLKIAELYSYNFYPALLEFMMLDHSHPSQFLNALETKRKDLEKVTALLIQKKGIVTADELIKHHIPKGPLIKEGLLFAMNLYAENPDLSQFEILQMTLMHLKTSLS